MNTGRKVYQFLKQVNADTLVPTGLVKANVLGDLDYQIPVTDYTTCPVSTWRAINPFCVQTPVCAPGWLLSPDGLNCQLNETAAATPPSGGGGTPGIVAEANNVQWNQGGALVMQPGYAADGTGPIDVGLNTPHFWVNGAAAFDDSTRNLIDGRMNAAGIWVAGHVVDGFPNNEFIGFSRKITIPTAKTYYVGISGDNRVKIVVNGIVKVDMTLQLGGPNFSFWNVYPVDLPSGDNFIELYGLNLGSVGGFAAEIYDITRAQLIAATTESDLNIVFSTKNIIGEPFDLGITIGWSCPAGWSLDITGVGDPVCKKITLASPTGGNSGNKGFSNRERLVNGSPDGFIEPNIVGGTGPYFPPVLDLINCAI